MSGSRRPSRRTATARNDGPSGVPVVDGGGSSSPTEQSSPTAKSTPTGETSPTASGPASTQGPPESQLSLGSLAPGVAGPDEFDEPDESADLLVSFSTEPLSSDGDLYGEGIGEWVYPQAVGGDVPTFRNTAAGASIEDFAAPGPASRAEASVLPPGPDHHEAARPGGVALQIRLAHIHLRTGSLFAARAELEGLAAREQLDTAAHLDLAETRWRTGDLHGAGEAAAVYLAGGGNEALGFVISAEALAIANRHDESLRQAEMALERCLVSELASVFAGMQRQASWPSAAWSPSEVDARPAPPVAAAGPEPIAVVSAMTAVEPTPEAAAAGDELTAGRSFLAAGDPMMAALHFGIAIRLAPASASAVLKEIGDRQDLPLQMVRGDALRLLGLEVDAGNAYLSVASALGASKSAPSQGEPSPAAGPETAVAVRGGAGSDSGTPEPKPPALPETPAAGGELPAIGSE